MQTDKPVDEQLKNQVDVSDIEKILSDANNLSEEARAKSKDSTEEFFEESNVSMMGGWT